MDGNDCCVAAVTACLGHSACPFAGQRGARHAQAYGQRGVGVGGSPRTTRSTRIPHRASAASGGGRALSRHAGLCPRGLSEGAQIAAGAAGTAGDTGEGSRGAGCASRAQWPGDREPVARYVAAVAGTGRKARTGNARPASGRARHSGGGIFSCTSWRWRGRPGLPVEPRPQRSGPCCRGFSSTQLSSLEMQGRAPAWKARLGGDGHPTGTRVRCRPCHAQSTAGSAATPSPSRGAPGPRGGGAVPARWRPEGTGLEPGREAACMTQASGLRGAAETPAGVRGRALQDVTSRLRLPPQGAGGWPQGPQRCGHCRCP